MSAEAERDENQAKPCGKCVNVLRAIVEDVRHGLRSDHKESPPVTLLRAIAAGADPSQSDRNLEIQSIPDGVKVKLPVSSTLPSLLRRWSAIMRDEDEEEDDYSSRKIPLATSPTRMITQAPPLEIELRCRTCSDTGPEGGARAFLMGPHPLSIVLCQNRIQADVGEVSEILTHEFVHLYDVQNLKLDLQSCENLAYSEIRAAKQAECRDTWSQLKSYCVKQKAIHATNNLFPLEGRRCIQNVFSRAYADSRPFED